MKPTSAARLAALAAALAIPPGCGPKAPKAPAREAVTPLLQQEANALKADGEKIDPILGVKATWTIVAIDVRERPDDSDQPWAGTIHFRIRGETRDTGGTALVDEFDRRFDYVYSASLGRWIFQLPPSPAPGP